MSMFRLAGAASTAGALIAIIHANAPIGSTVDFSFGGVVIGSITASNAVPNADESTADYYFRVSSHQFGTWTVTARPSTKSASTTVNVSADTQYDVALVFRVYLFENGVGTNTSLVGSSGWYKSAGTLTNTSSTLGLTAHFSGEDPSGKNYMILRTSALIDLTNYNELIANIKTRSETPGLYVSKDTGQNPSKAASILSTGTGLLTLDISLLSGTYYVGFYWVFGNYGEYDPAVTTNNVYLQ